MNEPSAFLLSDHLMGALAALHRARKAVASENSPVARETLLMEVTQAELSISRVIGLIAGVPR
jgi:hypothetical protein